MVSKHWANALMREWTAQALLEQEYHLKQSVMSSDDPLKEAESQIFFISLFAKPLLELTVKAAPNLSMYYHHCKANLRSWHQRKAILFKQRSGDVTTTTRTPPPPLPNANAASSPDPPPLTRQADGYHSAFPLALPNYRPKSDNNNNNSSSRTTSSSVYGSQPQSPSCESESLSSSSAMLSPISDVSYHSSTTSTSSNNTTQSHIPSSHAAIRAASKSGGLKLQAQKNKKGCRNSWGSTTSTPASGVTTTTTTTTTFSQFQSQPPPPSPFTLTLPTTTTTTTMPPSSAPSTPPLEKDNTFTTTTFSTTSSSLTSFCPRSILTAATTMTMTTPTPPLPLPLPLPTTPPSPSSSSSTTTPSVVASILTSGPIKIEVPP